MKQKNRLVLSILAATAFLACTKHNGDVEELMPTATLTLTQPTEGATYQSGDSVLVQGVAVASDVMHGYEISVRNAADTSVVYYAEHIHDHNDTLYINQKWKDTVATTTNLQLEVTLFLDHEGHTSSKKVSIKTQN